MMPPFYATHWTVNFWGWATKFALTRIGQASLKVFRVFLKRPFSIRIPPRNYSVFGSINESRSQSVSDAIEQLMG